jgi:hypothetical protein
MTFSITVHDQSIRKAQTRGHKKFFQVPSDMQDAQTMEREEGALQEGMKELKIDGEIVTLDSYLLEGIKL